MPDANLADDSTERMAQLTSAFRERFKSQPSVAARAPGRVDLMGSHTDYNEGCILTLPINRDTWIVGSASSDANIEIFSLNQDSSCAFAADATVKVDGWGSYAQGVVAMLRESGYSVPGFRAAIHGTVPIGSGLSSSASMEAAVATFVEQLGNFKMDRLEKAKLCQRAENNWVGMNCGILDQYSSIMGRQGSALLLDCRTLTHEYVDLPSDMAIVICNTCVPRELTNSEFGLRVEQCHQGAAYFREINPELKTLRDVPIEVFQEHEGKLPNEVRLRSNFIIEEQARVSDFADAIRDNDRDAIRRLAAESFAGARDLFQISVPAMEHMYAAMDQAPGRIGCRQAGAGFGGCMIALVDSAQVSEFCGNTTAPYRAETGIEPEIYAVHSADGAGPLALG